MRIRTAMVGVMLLGTACAADSEAEQGVRVTVETTIVEHEGVAKFLTPNMSVVDVPTSDIVGKPFVVSIFEAGFTQGDQPLDVEWGYVPEDMVVSVTGAHGYLPGPYDTSVIVYLYTEVSEEEKTAEKFSPTVPVGGDLSAFTLGSEDVVEGDPLPMAGLVRINVGEEDVTKVLSNKVPENPDQALEAFKNTILSVP